MTNKQREEEKNNLPFIQVGSLSGLFWEKWHANLAGSYLGSATRLLPLVWWVLDKVDLTKWRQKDNWMEGWGERKSKRKSDRAWGERQSRVKTLSNGLFVVLSKETWGLKYCLFCLPHKNTFTKYTGASNSICVSVTEQNQVCLWVPEYHNQILSKEI